MRNKGSFQQLIKIDVTRLVLRFMQGRLPTGIDRVSLAYVKHYGDAAQAVIRNVGQCWVMSKKESQELFSWFFSSSYNTKKLALIIARGIVKNLGKDKGARGFLLNIDHNGLTQANYFSMIRAFSRHQIFFVHDLIPVTHPEYFRSGEDKRHELRMLHVLSFASGVILNSEQTLKELSDFAIKNKKTVPPSLVAHLAPGLQSHSPGISPLREPYFVVLSTIEPRKNHILLLQIWRDFVTKLGEKAPRLVMIGQQGWECEHVINFIERCPALKKIVIKLPICTDNELVTYLHYAQALLYPSFIEGYGLPVAEALNMGVPVIASDLSVFREIFADIPDYASPLDGKRWSELILSYSDRACPYRAAQLRRMQSLHKITWREHFEKIDFFLDYFEEQPV